MQELEIPTGVPLVYKLGKDLKPIKAPGAVAPLSGIFLGDADEIAAARQAVADQTKAGKAEKTAATPKGKAKAIPKKTAAPSAGLSPEAKKEKPCWANLYKHLIDLTIGFTALNVILILTCKRAQNDNLYFLSNSCFG